jgi:outer membrane beta-barrel protein
MKLLSSLLILLLSCSLHAVTIEFPEDELARESVLPVFDNAVAVKSRLVPTAKRVELGLAMGFAMNEPFFNSTRFGGHVAYNFNETHGFVLQGQMYSDGLGKNGKNLANTDLNSGTGPNATTFIRMEYAPQPKYHLIANYQITPYYGKISVFKDFIMNLSLYGLLGAGVMDIGGQTTPVFNIGMGQKFYFSKRWGIRADLGLMAYNGVNYFAGSGGTPSPLQDTSGSAPDTVTSQVPVGSFDREMNFDMHLSIAVIVLL